MKNPIIALLLFTLLPMTGINAQQHFLRLEDCHNMAIENSKSLKIKQEQAAAAKNLKKAAFTQHLPSISATGAYFRNSDNISLLSEDKFSPIGSLMADGSFGFRPDQVNNQWTSINGQPVPLDANGQPFNPKTNPEKIEWRDYAYLPKEEFTIDNRNVFAGGISLIQPLYLGGKIREMNKLARAGENIAQAQQAGELSDILYQTDLAYWQVVTISQKLIMAAKYRELLEKLNSDVVEMEREGVATQGDILKVKVRYNEADLSVIKAQNGLSLSRMHLCQLIGINPDEAITLADENDSVLKNSHSMLPDVDMDNVFANRAEIKQLEEMGNISHSKVKVEQSRFLPNVGLVANYLLSNPNPYNGFANEFKGSWNVGVMVSVPIFHFGDRNYTLNAAKSAQRISQYKLDDAKEQIELQVRQSLYKITEAAKRLSMTDKNFENAAENLRTAELAYLEGVVGLSTVMEAQTGWQMAYSEKIDALIEMRLCEVYLQKSIGNLKE